MESEEEDEPVWPRRVKPAGDSDSSSNSSEESSSEEERSVVMNKIMQRLKRRRRLFEPIQQDECEEEEDKDEEEDKNEEDGNEEEDHEILPDLNQPVELPPHDNVQEWVCNSVMLFSSGIDRCGTGTVPTVLSPVTGIILYQYGIVPIGPLLIGFPSECIRGCRLPGGLVRGPDPCQGG